MSEPTQAAKEGDGFPAWLWIAIAAMLAVLAAVIAMRLKQSAAALQTWTEPVISRYGMIGEFSLTDQNGATFERSRIDGKVWAANFIFTSCSAECPLLARRMQEIQSAFRDDPRVELVSISVDPRTDNPGRLKQYAALFEAGERWSFLTGEPGVIGNLIAKGFLLTSPDSAPADNAAPRKYRQMLHSEKIAVVDQLGVVRYYAEGMNPQSSRQVISVIRRLLEAEQPLPSNGD